jgi:hypothetical protein
VKFRKEKISKIAAGNTSLLRIICLNLALLTGTTFETGNFKGVLDHESHTIFFSPSSGHIVVNAFANSVH